MIDSYVGILNELETYVLLSDSLKDDCNVVVSVELQTATQDIFERINKEIVAWSISDVEFEHISFGIEIENGEFLYNVVATYHNKSNKCLWDVVKVDIEMPQEDIESWKRFAFDAINQKIFGVEYRKYI